MIKYEKIKFNYKYKLTADATIALKYDFPHCDFKGTSINRFNGIKMLTIRKGFMWDGPSGPTVDTPESIEPSMVHDALYELIRKRLSTPSFVRKQTRNFATR